MDVQTIAGAALGLGVGFVVLLNSKWRWKFPAYWVAGLLLTWAAYLHYDDVRYLKFMPVQVFMLILGLLFLPKRQTKSKKRRSRRHTRKSYR